jgi:lysine 2,3-aminomutase
MESTAHFRTPLHRGLAIVQSLRNHISGLAIPQFVVDLPGGHGKVPLVPNAILRVKQDRVVFRDFTGKNREYPLMPGEEDELKRFLSAD